ncbi:TAXI family TRAP transporter solute-binding subunit [Halomarina halobia]|uniref:TAXI family TRAP transporter solute-binding subunit n=1 Tax=Halomarina halobia TaxID=3033386 RepID=A0ABD6A647_9EURY|nr:TAXI family TRAP transporter solute-binding subunit [Halomarina sp. PSR21]
MVVPRGPSSRRTFLKSSLGAAGALTLAGCLGGEGGTGNGGGNGSGGGSGPTDMVMHTATETTAAYAMSQGIAAVVNDNTDAVRIDARPSEGTNANIGQLNRNEAHIVYIQNWSANKIEEGEEPFSDLSFQPYQVHHLYDLGWFLCSGNDGWETVADIEPDSRVSPTPRGSGTAEMLEHALGYVTSDYERISVDYGGQASAMSEGRLDVGAGTFVNFSVEPGWLQEMKGTVDLRLLDFPDDATAEMESDPALLVTEIDTGEMEGYAHAPDPLIAPSLAYNFVVRNDFSYDAVYGYLEALHGNREGLGEYHGLLTPLADEKYFLENPYDMPFHPAAADFYEELGIWSDDLTRGEKVE